MTWRLTLDCGGGDACRARVVTAGRDTLAVRLTDVSHFSDDGDGDTSIIIVVVMVARCWAACSSAVKAKAKAGGVEVTPDPPDLALAGAFV